MRELTAVGGCSACSAEAFRPHLSVAGGAGHGDLIPSTDRYGVALADIVRCASCGHMQLERFPPPAALAEGYAEASSGDYIAEEPGQRATARVALDVIERHAERGALLDLGCWVGYLLDEARSRGWRTVGVEPSVFASTFARERLGLDVRTGDLFTVQLASGTFDAVVLGDVIEHLPNPGAALDRIATLSRPGAVLYLTLPDAGSRVARTLGARWWSVLPTHVQYFTRHSLTTLLARHGWELVDLRTAPKAFSVRYYAGRIGGYSEPISRSLIRLADAAGVAERLWAPDFGDRIAALARLPAARSRTSSRTPAAA